tara:strand:- start:408 stop:815 length:408 start_codon:yes stop_codon:yes gene_type:complete
MLEDNINIRVRYADTDQMGFVYYGNYAKYYEIARVELFRNIGLTYKSLEEMGIGMPVIKMKTNFIMPAKYDEKLVIQIKIPELPKLKIIFFYEIFNEKNELINTGETVLTFINLLTRKPKRVPSIMKDKLSKYFE